MVDEFLDLAIHGVELANDSVGESLNRVLDFNQFFINSVEDLTSFSELLFNTDRFSSSKFIQGVSINLILICIKFKISKSNLDSKHWAPELNLVNQTCKQINTYSSSLITALRNKLFQNIELIDRL